MHPAIRYLDAMARAGLGRHVRWLPLFVALTVGGAFGPLGFALNSASSNAAVPHRPASSSVAVRSFEVDALTLEPLRTQAAGGDTLANLKLIDVLLDRFDATGDPGALYEAMIWVDRRWLMSGYAEAGPRVQARYCGQPVVRWHLMCHPGE
jgi:hypothetical protein